MYWKHIHILGFTFVRCACVQYDHLFKQMHHVSLITILTITTHVCLYSDKNRFIALIISTIHQTIHIQYKTRTLHNKKIISNAEC